MKHITDKEILSQAVETYGLEAQVDMLIEEMAELTVALNKMKRKGLLLKDQTFVCDGGESYNNLHEEFADVQIVMAQLQPLLDPILLSNCRNFKLKRLNHRLNP